MRRTAAAWAAAATAGCLAGGPVLGGVPGLLGVLVGAGVAWAVFGSGAVLMAGTAHLEPTATTLLAVGAYVVQALLLLVVVVALGEAAWLSRAGVAVAVVVVSVAWLGGLMTAHARTVRSSALHV